jgi:dihydropyrimidinase
LKRATAPAGRCDGDEPESRLAQHASRPPADFTQIPSGVPGIEHRLSLLYHEGVRTGRLSLPRFVEVTATAPARTFGLWPRKGSLVPGADADLVLFDPERTRTISTATHAMAVDYDPYERRQVRGAPVLVALRGEVIVEDGRVVGRPGRGQFLPRAPFGR